MRIQDVTLYAVGTRRENGTLTPHIIAKLTADDGTVGIGEMSDLGHNPVKPDVALMEDRLRTALKGVDPFDPPAVDPIVDQYQAPLGAGIDIAIHDLRAKSLGVPIHDLYGGAYRDRYKICYPIFRQFDESEIDPNIDRVRRMLALGFDLFRVYVGGNVDVDERFLHKLRDEFGDKVRIKSLDFSRRLDWKSCVAAIERLEWIDPILVESPAPDIAGKRKVRERVRFPISEHCGNDQQAIAFAEGEAVDILNITTCHQGIRRSRHLFTIAEACGLSTLIGTTQELSIGTSAQAHLGASVPNLEFPGDAAGAQLYLDDVVEDRVQYENGYLVVPTGPGLGMALNDSQLEALGDNSWGFFKSEPLGRQEDRK
ncbi:MAG: muconate cycloisomerase [Gemmatimonadetes bacterium]|nr:muconate cycloisomerase [Gemmatimonadota bacterium]